MLGSRMPAPGRRPGSPDDTALRQSPPKPEARQRSAGNDEELAGGLVEGDGTRLATHDDVLDARPVAALEIDPGLDAERVARLHRLAVARDEVRLLVALEPDAVPGAMEEVRPEPGR